MGWTTFHKKQDARFRVFLTPRGGVTIVRDDQLRQGQTQCRETADLQGLSSRWHSGVVLLRTERKSRLFLILFIPRKQLAYIES
jgi:hypothetical protein